MPNVRIWVRFNTEMDSVQVQLYPNDTPPVGWAGTKYVFLIRKVNRDFSPILMGLFPIMAGDFPLFQKDNVFDSIIFYLNK